jgi:hypothetical protein
MHFWSKFVWLNGSFLQCNRSKLEEFVRNCLENSRNDLQNLSFQLIEQSLNKIELIRPRGEIDPIIYEQIINDYKLKFQSEIQYEFILRLECREQYEYSLNLPIHQWEKQMNQILNEIHIEQNDSYRFNNEQYQILIVYLTKQLIDELLNKIIKKKIKKFINNGEKILLNFIEILFYLKNFIFIVI